MFTLVHSLVEHKSTPLYSHSHTLHTSSDTISCDLGANTSINQTILSSNSLKLYSNFNYLAYFLYFSLFLTVSHSLYTCKTYTRVKIVSPFSRLPFSNREQCEEFWVVPHTLSVSISKRKLPLDFCVFGFLLACS